MTGEQLLLNRIFDGPAYEPEYDQIRLTGQIRRIFLCMRDNQWRTLDEIAHITEDPITSISAQLRHLRKKRFGSHTVDRRPKGNRQYGLWEYRLTVNPQITIDWDEENK